MEREGSAIWVGGLKNGRGTISTKSGALDGAAYSSGTRFREMEGSNPEELVAAAHAACFSMALSAELEKDNLSPRIVRTTARVSLEKRGESWEITRSALEVSAEISGADQEVFERAAQRAKAGCPVSKLLKADIQLRASLEEQMGSLPEERPGETERRA